MTLQEKLAVTEAEYAQVQKNEREAWRIYSEAKERIELLNNAWHALYRRGEHLEKSIAALKELVSSETDDEREQRLQATRESVVAEMTKRIENETAPVAQEEP